MDNYVVGIVLLAVKLYTSSKGCYFHYLSVAECCIDLHFLCTVFLSNRYSMVGSAKQLLSSANPEHHVQAVSQLRWAIWPLWASGSAIRRLVEAGVHEQLLGLIQADVSHGKASLISTV